MTFLIILLFLTFFSCSEGKNTDKENSNDQNLIPVKVLTLKADNFTEIGEYYGRVTGINEAALNCISGGTVEKINIKEGDFVAKGTSLGSIDADSAIANYEMAQLNERIAFEDYERNQKFLSSGNASRVEVDRSNLAYLQSKSALIQAKENYDSALCISPIDGIVVARHIDLYQELPPGSQTFTVAQLDKLKITIGIPEKEMSGVQEGNKAVVRVDMFPGVEFEGELVRLAREISTRTLKFEAEIQIENPDRKIMSGVTALVILERKKLENQIIVPTAAILVDGNTRYVMTANSDTARQVFVETGPSNKTHTVILNGLYSGDKLIIEGNALVKNNSPIKVIE
jgi:membrane fusion protein (multidrug efflux system)